MRVSIVNCVSTAAEMMAFSDRSLLGYTKGVEFDYVIVKWLASPEVEKYLVEMPQRLDSNVTVHVVEHHTNPDVGFVPNLRAMMNLGFSTGFRLNAYCGLVNTDCYFGPNWLKNLVNRTKENRVINSVHITRATPPKPARGIVTEDLGVPLPDQFDKRRFAQLYDQLYKAEEFRAPVCDYRQAATMPYLFHRRYWEECGPWELTTKWGTPDVRFFDRIAFAGAEFVLALDSIVYHHEAVERRGARPEGAENLPEE